MTSSLGVEDLLAAEWIRTSLINQTNIRIGAPGGIWDGPARDGTKYPLVQIDLQSAVDLMVTDGITVWSNMLWLVRGVCEGSSYVPLRPVATTIYNELHHSHDVPVEGGMMMWCVREQAYRQEVVEGGREYRHLGGIYRIVVQSGP